ncbi:hypothetical protein CDAR_404451 [Caerostris darwini]|uniref:Uncharacterized protein n=1 Tax=Caerostris darwini TaxID=1538125 RepID=A0AAV4SPF1_9ARAC|nr:hypothetical protein CDAR_404451 [Caerostris darwini]
MPYWLVIHSPGTFEPHPLPPCFFRCQIPFQICPHFFSFLPDIHPRQHDRRNSSSSKSRGAPKCYRFFRIQNTEVMLIDDRNIAEIHALRFFREVAAATAPLGGRSKKKTLASATGRSVGGK